MADFVLEDGVLELFPELELALILAKGVQNDPDAAVVAAIQRDLVQAQSDAKRHITTSPLSQCPAVAVWREAFKKFKTKRGARCSIEALLKRVESGKGLGSVNPLVDLYNIVSLSWGLPCGGEDLDTIQGDLRLRVSPGGEPFLPLGSDQEEPTLAGEVCYSDDAGALCRGWNWREGQRTMLRPQTTRALLVLEFPDGSRSDDLKAAAGDLAQKVETLLGGSVTQFSLNRHCTRVSLD